MGPCVWHARYGSPGAPIRAWLASENWHPAGAVTSMRRRALHASADTGLRPIGSAGGVETFSRTRDYVDWYGQWFVDPDELACVNGRDAACMAILHSTRTLTAGRREALLPSGIVRRPQTMMYWNRQLLAAIEDGLGPENFGAFWTSTQSPSVALQEAAGASVPTLLREQLAPLKQTIGGSPWPNWFEWLLWLGLMVLIPGSMAVANRRRTISA